MREPRRVGSRGRQPRAPNDLAFDGLNRCSETVVAAQAGPPPAHSRSAKARPHAGRWKVVSGSVPGTSHVKAGAVCHDSHVVLVQPDGVLLAAISDGAGSVTRPELGAEIAARTAVHELKRWRELGEPWPATDGDWAAVMRRAMVAARIAVESEAAIQGLDPRDLSATLILILASPTIVVAGQIGDGAVVVSGQDGSLTPLTSPAIGEYLNETTFLITPGAVELAQVVVFHGAPAYLAAFSDGLQMLALRMSDGAPHPPFFVPLFRFVLEHQDMEEARKLLVSFLTSPRIAQRSDDDLTLLLAQYEG